ncbi:MAG: hypothetical protein ACXABY_28395 [Candidatus Thorarchaeota archaeon]|jgi:hypothetical protein
MSGIKWLLGLLLGGLFDILKWIAKAITILLLLLCMLFALGKAVGTEWDELKQAINTSIDKNPLSKMSWQGLINRGTDPPLLYRQPLDIAPAVGHTDPFGYQSSQVYEGHLVPLRL